MKTLAKTLWSWETDTWLTWVYTEAAGWMLDSEHCDVTEAEDRTHRARWELATGRHEICSID